MNGLLTNLEELPFGPKEVSVVGGHFDLIHPGHIKYLKECKRHAEGPLVVLVANDDATSLRKPGRPIISEQDRAEMLLALKCVDYVHICSQNIKERSEVYRLLSPQKVFYPIEKVLSSLQKNLMKLLQVEFPEIQLVSIPRQRADISTTQIIDKIIKSNYDNGIKNKPILETRAEIKSHLEKLSKKSKETQKVGAILINNETSQVLASGYNSVAEADKTLVEHRNTDDTYESKNNIPRAFHAESDVVCKYVVSGHTDFSKITLYVTVEPCAGCAQLISRLGIKKVRYFKDFDNNFGTLILKKNNIDIQKI